VVVLTPEEKAAHRVANAVFTEEDDVAGLDLGFELLDTYFELLFPNGSL
jgi:hypothetical protein